MLHLYNTLSRSVEDFTPIKPLSVGLYSCGPTVYDYAHIGHMRKYTMDDILVRVLRANGYIVKHVMNITDVGHLVSDEDTGEDKMEKGAKKYGMTVWDIAKKFEEQFFSSTSAMHIQKPDEIMHATDFIKEQIELIQTLEKKGYTYEIAGDGIYFDTSKFPDYFELSRQNPEELKKGARVEFVEGKKNPADFALWKFSPTDERRQMEWESPWGIGFPGWHIECSAMSLKALTNFYDDHSVGGERSRTIDIHTGGIDHIPVHHSNEIAQSEAATGEKFVNYWVHHNFLIVNGEKMSKSLGNTYTVKDILEKGYDPMALRYLFLQTHYRQEMNFTWESLDAAQTALERLRSVIPAQAGNQSSSQDNDSGSRIKSGMTKGNAWMERFMDALNDDLNTSKALAVVWEMVKDENLSSEEKQGTLLEMDTILGLDLESGIKNQELRTEELPEEVQSLIQEREAFRKAGDFAASDELRDKIYDLGFTIQDTPEGPILASLRTK
jgi:cysteinyl-tRNA synthetase